MLGTAKPQVTCNYAFCMFVSARALPIVFVRCMYHTVHSKQLVRSRFSSTVWTLDKFMAETTEHSLLLI